MTKEEAWRRTKGYLYDVLSGEEADEIIKALSCGDTISRREAIKKFTYNYKGQRIPDYDCDNWPIQIDLITVRKYLRELPPVISQSKEKTGHWEYVQYDYNPKLGNWHCSECRCVVVECVNKEEKGGIPLYKYCPQCGTKMIELQAESDHKCHNCKHYVSGQRDGSCGSYICKNYSGWESEG